MFDIDNTIAPYDVAEPDDSIVKFFAMLKNKGSAFAFYPIMTKKELQNLMKNCMFWQSIRQENPELKN